MSRRNLRPSTYRIKAMGEIHIRRTLNRLRSALAAGWAWLRRLSGDDAYEQYLIAHTHPSGTRLTRSEFECRRLEMKWNRISRCC